jgi:hypothetical protein
VKKMSAVFPFIGIVLFLGAMVIQGFAHGWDTLDDVVVANAVTYLIGAQAFGAGIGHLFFGPPIAESIGWKPSPFQWEVGAANLGIGIAGVLATNFGREYWLAVIIVATTFLWLAAVGHVREIIVKRNFAVSNAGPILFTDVLVPAFCLAAWFIWA